MEREEGALTSAEALAAPPLPGAGFTRPGLGKCRGRALTPMRYILSRLKFGIMVTSSFSARNSTSAASMLVPAARQTRRRLRPLSVPKEVP